jgi:hypothetical protein
VWLNGLDSARARLGACTKLDTFRRVLLRCQADPRTDGVDLDNWLARPGQHVMRQPLVVANLLDFTQPEHPDYASLRTALEAVQSIVTEVNNKKADYEQRGKLVALQSRLRGHDDVDELVQPHRQLLREGELYELESLSPSSASSGGPPYSPAMGSKGRADPPDTHTPKGRRNRAHGAPKFGVLCNDSLWLCEALRGNRYSVLHVFRFGNGLADLTAAADVRGLSRGSVSNVSSSSGGGGPALASVEPGTTDAASFWVRDAQLAVELRPVRAEGAALTQAAASAGGARVWFTEAQAAQRRSQRASGLTWRQEAGPTPAWGGAELRNSALTAAIAEHLPADTAEGGLAVLGEDQWAACSVKDLRMDHFVVVGGDRCFVPLRSLVE